MGPNFVLFCSLGHSFSKNGVRAAHTNSKILRCRRVRHVRSMSALSPKADIRRRGRNVRSVPIATDRGVTILVPMLI